MADEFCSEHSGMVQKSVDQDVQLSKQWDIIQQLQTRLPLWATGAISGLTFLLGLAMGWIFHLESLIKEVAHL